MGTCRRETGVRFFLLIILTGNQWDPAGLGEYLFQRHQMQNRPHHIGDMAGAGRVRNAGTVGVQLRVPPHQFDGAHDPYRRYCCIASVSACHVKHIADTLMKDDLIISRNVRFPPLPESGNEVIGD
jgi:hypothetical protein